MFGQFSFMGETKNSKFQTLALLKIFMLQQKLLRFAYSPFIFKIIIYVYQGC